MDWILAKAYLDRMQHTFISTESEEHKEMKKVIDKFVLQIEYDLGY